MNIVDIGSSLDIVVFENVYSDKEIKKIWNELENIYDNNFLLDPKKTGSAVRSDGSYMKKNKSLFVDNIYTAEYRNMSPILKYTEEKLLSNDVKNILSKKNPSLGTIHNTNQHSTLVSYYEESDHYDFHQDSSAYSTLSYFYKEPKSFVGGDIIFSVNNLEIEIKIKNNMSIIFPSCYEHKVLSVKMNKNNNEKMMGRFCISHFLGIQLI